MTINRKTEFFRGLKASVPVILGYIPVGIAYAIMAMQAGFSVGETVAMSIFVFAGAAQMMAAGLYAQGAALAGMIVTTFILNLRHLIMSTCVMNRLSPGNTALKLLASFGITDESFAVFTTGENDGRDIFFLLGLALGGYLSWVLSSLFGALTSVLIPPALTASMGIALYAMFIGLLAPSLRKNIRLLLLALMAAACNGILSMFMASSWALIASTLACAFAGVFFVDLEEDNNGQQ